MCDLVLFELHGFCDSRTSLNLDPPLLRLKSPSKPTTNGAIWLSAHVTLSEVVLCLVVSLASFSSDLVLLRRATSLGNCSTKKAFTVMSSIVVQLNWECGL